MAEAHYIELMPHDPLGPICTAATIHLAAAVPNFAWLEAQAAPTKEQQSSEDELFPIRPKLKGSYFPVSDGPGLGIEVNENLTNKTPFKFWEAPHLYRHDGSFTNW